MTAVPKDTALRGFDEAVALVLHNPPVVNGLELVDLPLVRYLLRLLTEISSTLFPPPRDVLVGGLGVLRPQRTVSSPPRRRPRGPQAGNSLGWRGQQPACPSAA